MRSIAIVVLAACTGSTSVESPQFELKVGVSRSEPADRPPAPEPPVVYINGVAGDRMKVFYDSVEEARDETFVIELRHGDRTVAEAHVLVSDNSCLHTIPNATSAGFGFCAYDSGDLRYSTESASRVFGGAGQACVGDGTCSPRCYPVGNSGCTTGTRCTSRVMSTSPLASHLACAPIGPKALGDACTLVADADGDYDDCGTELLCVEGTCRPVCSLSDPTPECAASQTCSWVPGHAPEMLVCL